MDRSLQSRPTFLLEGLEPRCLLAATFYVSDGVGDLFTVNTGTGQTQRIGNMGVEMFDIAMNAQGVLYGVDSRSELYRISSTTAATTRIGPVGTVVNALAFNSAGKLYAASNSLYSINTSNGAATFIGSLGGFTSDGDLDFDAQGRLFLSTTSGQLAIVDPTNGRASALGSTGFSEVFGMAFGSDSVMYGISNTNEQVFSLNLATGQGTFVRQFLSLNGVRGATARPLWNTVAITAADSTASEPGADTGRFTITRTGSTAASLTVRYSVTGSATNGTDYNTLGGTIVIGAGAASSSITVTVKNDNIPEPQEKVTLNLSSNAVYSIGSPSTATVNINDNDPDAGNTAALAANLGTLSRYVRTESVGGSIDVADIYRFSIAKNSNLTLSLTGSVGNAQVLLYQDANNDSSLSSGEVLKQSFEASTKEWISTALTAASNFYIRIISDPLTSSATYTLDVKATAYLASGNAFNATSARLVGLLGVGSTTSISPTKPTWIVIHGRFSGPYDKGIATLAAEVDRYSTSDQVFTLDWSSASRSASTKSVLWNVDLSGEEWIPKVATWLTGRLVSLGFNSTNRINLVGHSWGGVMTAEIASRMKLPTATTPFGVNRIVALDPAQDGSLNGFNTNNVNFATHSLFARSFLSSALGSATSAATADESFRASCGAYSGVDLGVGAHRNIVPLFTTILNRANSGSSAGVSKYFGFGTMTTSVAKIWKLNTYDHFGVRNVLGKYEGFLTGVRSSDIWSPSTFKYVDLGGVERVISG